MKQSLRGYRAGLAALHVRFRVRLLIQTLAIALVIGVSGSARGDEVPRCGDGILDPGEECDDGGLCIGGSNAGTPCVSESQCIGNGVCDGGTKSFYACANDSGCPGGKCIRCKTFGGDDCAANCTLEHDVPVNLVPGIVNGLDIKPATSGQEIHGDILTIPLPIEGTETLTIGGEGADGHVPVVIKTNTIRFQRIPVGACCCACERGVTAKTCGGTFFDIDGVTPSTDCTDGFTAGASVCPADKPCTFIHGPGNAASGVVGCAYGYVPIDMLWTQDSGGSGGIHGKPIITLSGSGGPGSALLLSTSAISPLGFRCTGTDATIYGPDHVLCTDDDPQSSRGTAMTFPLTTGTATGAVMNANGTNGDNLGGPFSVSGAPFNCAALLTAAGNAAGAALAGVSVALNQPVFGDVVITSVQVASEPPTPTPTPTPISCVGDCDGNGAVTIDELIAMVNIALGSGSISTCPAGACAAGFESPVDISCILKAVNNALYGCGIAPPTPTPSPLPTATLGPGQCRSGGDCHYYDWCSEPGGFLGCAICYPDSNINLIYHRCSTDADCLALGASEVCNELGFASRTCDPCVGSVSVCMQGCSQDSECGSGQACEQHRCVGGRCSNDQQCPALFTCALAGGGTSRCLRRSCTTDTDCGDGFCVFGRSAPPNGLCYGELGQCVPIPV